MEAGLRWMELSQGRIRQGWGLSTPQCLQCQSAEDQALNLSRLPEVEWGWGEGNTRCIPLDSGGSFPSQTDTVEVRVSLQVWVNLSSPSCLSGKLTTARLHFCSLSLLPQHPTPFIRGSSVPPGCQSSPTASSRCHSCLTFLIMSFEG